MTRFSGCCDTRDTRDTREKMVRALALDFREGITGITGITEGYRAPTRGARGWAAPEPRTGQHRREPISRAPERASDLLELPVWLLGH